MKKLTIVTTLIFILVGCLSVKFPSGKATPAAEVAYQSPPSPFIEIKNGNSDRAWVSDKTGNTISFLSECGSSVDLPLEQIESEALSALSNLEISKAQDFTFNDRAARQSQAQGLVDGVPVKIGLLVFKKNNCNFTLSYGGKKKNFEVEQNIFEFFKHNFRAP